MEENSKEYSTSNSPVIDGQVQTTNRNNKFDLTELGIGLLCFIIFGLAIALAFILIKAEDNAANLKDVKQSNQILVDCTTPGHKCYDEGKKNTASILLNFRNNQILIAHCVAIGNESVKDITTCVNKPRH